MFLSDESRCLRLVIISGCRQGAALIAFLPQECKYQNCNAGNIGHGSRNDQAQAAQEEYNTL
jgi:hypothetical protein